MSRLKAMPNDVEVTPITVILERIAAELGSLAANVDRLQDSLGPLLLDAAGDRPQAMVEIQSLDSLAQTLANLSGFVADLGDCDLGSLKVAVGSLADRLSLSDLGDRLRGHPSDASDDDFEFF